MTPTAPDRPQPLFRRIRRAWHDAPFVVPALAFAVLVFAWLWALDPDRPSEGAGTEILRAVVALAAGTAMAGARRLARLHHPGSPSDVEVSEAAEDGGLPRGADPTAWQDALYRRRRQIRQEAWGVPVALVLVVGLAFLPQPVGDGLPFAYVVLLALFVPYAASLIVSRPRRRDSVDALLVPLQERSRAEEERRVGWAPPSPDDRIPPAAG
ncbi:hypothetical protein [Clavibacter michiganensis]|uniref:hypothetical protein n=1 Tax=Clavibacter michiganensis TaxID=28447 RepID=UPI001AE3DE60|nr:hypothetical protein [Clavibacter michiganensis]MBP2458631.1 hypothetical protein [Clavibacter michiganensis]MDQ0411203.1 hypothetical protein [Clavibacter michiganensis]